jgi:hypothetical protein
MDMIQLNTFETDLDFDFGSVLFCIFQTSFGFPSIQFYKFQFIFSLNLKKTRS